MIAFLLKSGLSLAILLGIYYLALQRERMHTFKRFYLLFAICFSFVIPFVEIQTTRENLPIPGLEILGQVLDGSPNLENQLENSTGKSFGIPPSTQLENQSQNRFGNPIVNSGYEQTRYQSTIPTEQVWKNENEKSPGNSLRIPPGTQLEKQLGYLPTNPMLKPPMYPTGNPTKTTNLLPFYLWSIYLIIGFLLLFRFAKNLSHIYSITKSNPTIQAGKATLVLLNHPIIPHSFLNYIFFNKKEYDNKKIEPELFQHELTHVQQHHSLDIIFIEFLTIIFWFNPLIFLYKKAIKLNHEFLADAAVLQTKDDVSSYQQILLNKIFMNSVPGLASPLNYSLTKKRLIMMTKNTSFIYALALKTATALLYTIVLLVLCTKVLAQQPPPPPKKQPGKQASKPTEKLQDTGRKVPPKVVFVNPGLKIKNQDSLRAIKEYFYSRKGEIMWSVKNGGESFKKKWSEMTDAEKEMLFPPPAPPQRMKVSQKQLDDWADAGKYGIWINGYRKKNAELTKYTPADFAHYSVSRLYPNAVNYKHHKFQVMVTTTEEFKKWRKQSLEDLGLPQDQ